MKEPTEYSYLRLVRDPDEELNLRLNLQSLMEEKDASIGYNYLRFGRFQLEKIFSGEILSFPMPQYVLEDALSQLRSLKYKKGAYPPVIHIYQKPTHPPDLRLIR